MDSKNLVDVILMDFTNNFYTNDTEKSTVHLVLVTIILRKYYLYGVDENICNSKLLTTINIIFVYVSLLS